ncbi:kinesin-like protein KIF21A isoform X2 [Folsomia candida]|uniref:kinesin-like protein KIF21A isoform X2 n=1 Tax=Folsomia candida TaxID=158441 RepID=UPI000B9095D1|nr:kinesin-like protein KIF21A isoform X2 [Folsomia candida]
MDFDDVGGGEHNFSEDNSSVRVALRIRPCLPREVIEGCKTCTTVAEGHPQVWIGSNHAFTYDYVFDQNAAQQSIFDQVVQQLIDGCLQGYNATILAYGQTGSGKTYTMGTGFEYDPSVEAQGIIPRAVTYLFSQIEKLRKEKSQDRVDFTVQLNFVELYNEDVVDLLNQSSMRPSSAVPSRPGSANGPIKIHEDTNGSIYLVGVQTVNVSTCHETLSILREGALSRTTASTNMNDTSSRSHAIFTMHVTQTRVSNNFGEAELETLSAKFHFVDLAGSERLKRTLATGDRQKEGISINCGLLALGNVISALGDKNRKAGHVPYRDSKLTRLLQDSLGGNSRTVMIACVSPSDRDFVETLNTLKYANRARNIKNRVQINQDKSSRTIASLRRQIEHLETELLEYKQGKLLGSDTLEFKDTYQENMLLLAEVESLKSRLKSKQESIDKLTSTIASQRTEEVLGEISGSASADCDLTNMIQKYIMEIEDLRTKLYEAEQECQKLRSKQRQLNTSLSSPRRLFMDPVIPVPNSDILEDARADIENDKKKLEQLSSKERDCRDESGDSESDSEEQEKMEEIVQLSSEISVKERLIEELERSQKHMENMKRHYEEKLDCLFMKMKATEQERDKVLGTLTSGKRSAQVNADYEKKLSNMQSEIKKWQNLQKEHAVALKNQASSTRQLDKLRSEVDNLKQTKVKLLKQAKVETARFRDIELKRQKEIMSLKKAQRVKDIKLKTLENEKIMKDQVLKRKLEEVNSLKRINKLQMSRKAQGKPSRPGTAGSPQKAKSKWSSLQHEIRKSVTIKTTVFTLEKEMLNLIEERTHTRIRLADLENIIMKDEMIEDDIESVKGNLNFLEERISEIQNQIAEMSAGIIDVDGSEFDGDEMQYMFKKMFEMNLMNLTDLERSERRVDDLEENGKQQIKEIASLRDLLHHMINRLHASRSNEDDDDIPELPPPTAIIEFQCQNNTGESSSSNMSKLRKARRLTSTPQELLGSLENVSVNKSEFLNPNDVKLGFLRGTRQTQSLRIPTVNKRRPQLQRQDTYNVADKKFHVDPPEKLRSETNRNGNHADVFNTTFLIEKSPPAPAPSSSSLAKFTNSPADINICDNNTNHLLNVDSKGIIRRVSNGVKDRVLSLTHTAEGHTKPVISMQATDSKLFTGSKDSTAKEFDLQSGVELATYSGHPNNVQYVKFLESEETLLTASSYVVKLWDIRSGTCQKTLTSSGSAVDKISFDSRLLPQGEHQIQSIAVLRNYLYTTFDNRIRVWDRRQLNSSIGMLAGKHSSNIMCLAASENVQINGDVCDIIVSGSKDHYVKLYLIKPDQSVESVQPRKNLNPPHYDGIEALLIKGSEVYSGSRDTCIKRWDMAESKMICCSSNAHAGWITGISNLPDSSLDYILSSSRDGSVKIWDKDLKEVIKMDVSNGGQNCQQPSGNFSVESLCVNSRLVFTAGGSTSNSNNGVTNGLVRDYGVGCWEFKGKYINDSRNNNQSSPS